MIINTRGSHYIPYCAAAGPRLLSALQQTAWASNNIQASNLPSRINNLGSCNRATVEKNKYSFSVIFHNLPANDSLLFCPPLNLLTILFMGGRSKNSDSHLFIQWTGEIHCMLALYLLLAAMQLISRHPLQAAMEIECLLHGNVSIQCSLLWGIPSPLINSFSFLYSINYGVTYPTALPGMLCPSVPAIFQLVPIMTCIPGGSPKVRTVPCSGYNLPSNTFSRVDLPQPPTSHQTIDQHNLS